MTGDELKQARQAAGLSQQQLGAKLGISWQTVGMWERLGKEDVLVARPRESQKTRQAKQDLVSEFSFMQAIGAFSDAMQIRFADPELMIPAPCSYPYYIDEGDPLVLCDDPATPGDLVVLRDGDGKLSFIGRVCEESMSGTFAVRRPRLSVEPLPPVGGYKTISYYMHNEHMSKYRTDFPADMT